MRFRHTQNRKRATDGGTRERKKEDPSFKFFFFINIFRDEVPPKKEENRCVRYTRRRRKPEGFHPTGGIGCFSASFFPLCHLDGEGIKEKSLFSFPLMWLSFKKNVFGWVPTSEESVADTLLPFGWRPSSRTSGPPRLFLNLVCWSCPATTFSFFFFF